MRQFRSIVLLLVLVILMVASGRWRSARREDRVLSVAPPVPPTARDDPRLGFDRDEPAEHDRLSALERALTPAVGEAFTFVRGTTATDGRGGALWLATLRADRPGEFVISCTAAIRPTSISGPDRVEFRYRLAIGPKGTPRAVTHGRYGTYLHPVAMPGDEVILPVNVGADVKEHRFALTPDRTMADTVAFRSAREIGDALRDAPPNRPPFAFRSDGAALAPFRFFHSVMESRARSGPISHEYSIAFDIRAAGRWNIVAEIEGPLGKPRVPAESVALAVVDAGQPLTQLLNRWERHAMQTAAGVRSYQTDTLVPGVLTLRVGDRLSLFCGGYATRGGEKPDAIPGLRLAERPFDPPAQPFR